MKSIRKILAAIRRADCEFNLIENGDRIMIGVSGGKDSMVLFYALSFYQKFSKVDFTFAPVILDLGFPNFNPQIIRDFMANLGYDLRIVDAREVYRILEIQKGDKSKLPCSICSRMKKAAMNKVAKESGFNKVAFAHHADDAIETLFMNEICGGRIATFSPKMYLSNTDITFIRPLILAREDDLQLTIAEEKIPTLPSGCPNDKHTMREETKNLLKDIYQKYPYAKENFLGMLKNKEQEKVWFDEFNYKLEFDNLYVRPVYTAEDAFILTSLRYQVFVQEQSINFTIDFDGSDANSSNFLLYKNNEAIGFIRYYFDQDCYRIGRFGIIKEARQKGYGKRLFTFLENYIHGKYGCCIIKINSQKYLQAFYENLGYQVDGPDFLEASIIHVPMKKVFLEKKRHHEE